MKKLTTSLAVLLLGTVLSHANNNYDLILGFQQETPGATGSTTNIEFDLGPAYTLINDAGTGAVVDLSADFSLSALSVYGSNPSTLDFGVAGTSGTITQHGVASYTEYVGSSNGGVPQDATSETTLEGNEYGLYSEYRGNVQTGYAAAAVSDAGSYTNVAGSDGTFQGNFAGFLTQAVFTGSGTQTLALYAVSQGNTNAASQFGTLALNDSTGTLTFTATASPEPSTYVMMGLGLAVITIVMRRRMANNA